MSCIVTFKKKVAFFCVFLKTVPPRTHWLPEQCVPVAELLAFLLGAHINRSEQSLGSCEHVRLMGVTGATLEIQRLALRVMHGVLSKNSKRENDLLVTSTST